ncbi:cell division protein FtsL [Bacillus sp. V3-13]|uniref:cell division protein FtsL n=1 Tax=Bacillus sp. V3-13 TaxID=2053728 RepID=UPI000C76C4AE|nr:cell division protein FtsL [Bacillus sp. V3-13]PLR77490.1 cell division protein FtsL [Bacillus sp. V3-13]
MSNLARKLQQEQQQRHVEVPKKASVKRPWLTPGEKFLGIVFAAVISMGAIHIVSSQAAIYEVNKDIQVLESSIQEQQKVNGDLENQVEELSTSERIRAEAEKLGLKLNENNVKVVQD